MSQPNVAQGSAEPVNQIQIEEPLSNIPENSKTDNTSKTQKAEDIVTVFDIASEIEGLLMDVQRQVAENDVQFQKSISAIETKLKLMQK